ncbi:unnamed protein product [Rotaria sp. Silwood1]|nr:unnamed protein product [Rotaria sp. Silwood1]
MVEKEKLDQSSPDHIQNIIRIKNYLLILLVIQWFTCIVTFVFGSYAILVSNSNNVSVESKFLVLVMTLVIYYIFGLVITYQQHRIGLLIVVCISWRDYIYSNMYFIWLYNLSDYRNQCCVWS